VIRSLHTALGVRSISAVSLLGSSEAITFEQKNDGLHLKLPSQVPGKFAYVYRIEFAR